LHLLKNLCKSLHIHSITLEEYEKICEKIINNYQQDNDIEVEPNETLVNNYIKKILSTIKSLVHKIDSDKNSPFMMHSFCIISFTEYGRDSIIFSEIISTILVKRYIGK